MVSCPSCPQERARVVIPAWERPSPSQMPRTLGWSWPHGLDAGFLPSQEPGLEWESPGATLEDRGFPTMSSIACPEPPFATISRLCISSLPSFFGASDLCCFLP